MLTFTDPADGYYEFAVDAPPEWYAHLTPCAPQLPPPKSAEQLARELETALDLYIDSVASQRGYGTATMCPTAACIAYAGYPNLYQAEAVAFGQWKASIWPVAFAIQAEVFAGTRPVPTAAELIAALPVLVWPV